MQAYHAVIIILKIHADIKNDFLFCEKADYKLRKCLNWRDVSNITDSNLEIINVLVFKDWIAE